MANAIEQYLGRYAQPEAEVAKAIEHSWPAAIVIPAYCEAAELLDGLRPALSESAAVVILVVNRRCADEDAEAENRQLLEAVRLGGVCTSLGEGIELVRGAFDTLLIDRSTGDRAFGDGDGVGLARRIGLDVALALWQQGRLDSDWLHTSDADVTLPTSYFSAATGAPAEALAITYPYRHQLDGEDEAAAEALALYEISLRYYLLGLRWAGSPYAFSAIGSTIAVRASAYAAARGVPRRQAGEDFYLLAKLAKLGQVYRPTTEPIAIRGVRRQRTPFGTAAAVAAISASDAPFAVYHPDCFELLRQWLGVLATLAETGQLEAAKAMLATGPLADALAPLHVESGLRAALSQAKSRPQRAARLHQFFDAKRTLRLIHNLRDQSLANLPWQNGPRAGRVRENQQ